MGLFARSRRDAVYTYHPRAFKTLETFQHDGVEVARRRRRSKWRLPIREIVLFALAIVAFKVFLYIELGGAAYGAKVEQLLAAEGSERWAGYAMQIDPVTAFVIETLRTGL
ncbi:MAG: hypothetical protein AAGP08_05515 [Pseudomonadota bacterium]